MKRVWLLVGGDGLGRRANRPALALTKRGWPRGLDVRAAYADAKTLVVREVLARARAVARRRLRRLEPSRRGRVRDAVRFPFMAHTCRLVPASDVNWLRVAPADLRQALQSPMEPN